MATEQLPTAERPDLWARRTLEPQCSGPWMSEPYEPLASYLDLIQRSGEFERAAERTNTPVLCGRCGTYFGGWARNGLYILHACDLFRAEADRWSPDTPPFLVESFGPAPELDPEWFWAGL